MAIIQDIDTIMAALELLIQTQVTDFGLVRQGLIPSKMLGAGDYPVCLIQEGGDEPSYDMTGTTMRFQNIALQIVTKGDADYSEGRGLRQQIIDALEDDIQLGGACIKCLEDGSDPPFYWPGDATGKHFMNFSVRVEYWRDRS